MSNPTGQLICITYLLWAASALGAETSAAARPAPRTAVEAALAPWVRASRIQIEAITAIESGGAPATKVLVSYSFIDPRGQPQKARGKLILPEAATASSSAKNPLMYAAGYEWDDGHVMSHVGRGFIVATPENHPLNPLSRTPNLDIALLHIVRAMPFVDDTRVMISGGSAGGYMTLMLAAETFPLAGAIATTPPVNLGYNVEYFLANHERLHKALGATGKPTVPVLTGVAGSLAKQVLTYLPADTQDAAWFEHSPIAHVSRITCPTTVVFSTGDVLVPINQVDSRLVPSFDPGGFPPGFTASPKQLMRTPQGARTLIESLPSDDYQVTHIPIPPQAVLLSDARPDSPTPTAQAPVSPKAWNIVVLDEGPMRPLGGHFEYRFGLGNDAVVKANLSGGIAARQLTIAKLQMLIDRYAGREWMAQGLRHLDDPRAERLDVLRGLTTYVSAGEEQSRTLATLYRQLPTDRKLLGQLPSGAQPRKLVDYLRHLANP